MPAHSHVQEVMLRHHFQDLGIDLDDPRLDAAALGISERSASGAGACGAGASSRGKRRVMLEDPAGGFSFDDRKSLSGSHSGALPSLRQASVSGAGGLRASFTGARPSAAGSGGDAGGGFVSGGGGSSIGRARARASVVGFKGVPVAPRRSVIGRALDASAAAADTPGLVSQVLGVL